MFTGDGDVGGASSGVGWSDWSLRVMDGSLSSSKSLSISVLSEIDNGEDETGLTGSCSSP